MHDMTKTTCEAPIQVRASICATKIWADKAEKDGLKNIARLFKAVSLSEQIHATAHFMVLRNEVGGAEIWREPALIWRSRKTSRLHSRRRV